MSNKAEAKLSAAQQKKLDSFSTTSARIRFLLAKGWERGDVARKLNIKYQHVRNVEITPVKKQKESIK